MIFLIVSGREYKKTSRGIDIITTFLAEKGHVVDHLVFFTRKNIQDKQITQNIRQLFLHDPIKLYRFRLQFLFPGFVLKAYFRFMIRNQPRIDFDKYDYVILESGNPIYLAFEIKNKIIYRQSDPTSVAFNSNKMFFTKLENYVMKKSLFVSSALDSIFYPNDYKNKFFFYHSGFIPYSGTLNQNAEKTFVIMGDNNNRALISQIAKKYSDYRFFIVGKIKKRMFPSNVTIRGYLEYNDYSDIVSTAAAIIIPYSDHFAYQLRFASFTAKILLAISMGLPILLRAYGTIQDSDYDKKLFVYKTNDEALALFDNIVKKIENGELSREVSEKSRDFLLPLTSENRLKELESTFALFFE